MTDLTESELEDYFFHCLEERLQALAMPADVQLALFPEGIAKVEELALEFDYALGMKWSAKRRRITPEQETLLQHIDDTLDQMSGPEPFWTEEALRNSPEWNAVRNVAKEALEAFGWEIKAPVWSHTYIYSRDGSFTSVTSISAHHDELLRKWKQERRHQTHPND